MRHIWQWSTRPTHAGDVTAVTPERQFFDEVGNRFGHR
jgi:hypothetical protein